MVDMCGTIESDVCADEFISAIDELRARNQWVGWKSVRRGESAKGSKVPANPHRESWASVDNPSTWGSHKQAKMAQERYDLAGVGFVLTKDDDYTGIDLDKCRNADTGEIEAWARGIVSLAETYAEISPSGTGIRMFVRGKVEKAIKSDVAHVEIYGSERYLTVTEKHVEGTPLDIREAPKTLAALIARVEAMSPKREELAEPERPRSTSSAPSSLTSDARGQAFAAKKLEEKAKELASVVEGGRNNAIVSVACSMGRVIARGWIDEATVRAALEDACRANGIWKDDGPKACRDAISRGIRAGLANQHEDLEDRESTEDDEALRIGNEIAAGLIERAKGRRETIIIDGDEIDPETGEIIGEAPSANDDSVSGADGQPNAEEAPRQQDERKKGVQIETVNAASLAGQPVPRQAWLIQDLIPKANVTMLAGDGATGKSLLGLQLAVATGGCWIGFRPEIGRALFLSAEDELDEVHRRLVRMAPRLEMLGNLTILPLAGKDAVLAAPFNRDGLLKETPLFVALRHIIQKHRPDFLVLDTLADIFGGDEIKKVHARQFIAMLRGLALDFGVTVLLLSHPSQNGMNSGSGMSGNTAWNNSVRSRLYFERRIVKGSNNQSIEDDVNIRVLKTMKSNRAAIGGQIVVRYDKGMFVREQASTLNARDAAHQAERVFLELLAKFTTQGRNLSPTPCAPTYAPNVFAKDDEGKGITKRSFEQAMSRLFTAGRIVIAESGPPSKRRQTIVLAQPHETEEPAMASDDDVIEADGAGYPSDEQPEPPE
jgi:RecA-family ATPase